jgi:hypothetical protein
MGQGGRDRRLTDRMSVGLGSDTVEQGLFRSAREAEEIAHSQQEGALGGLHPVAHGFAAGFKMISNRTNTLAKVIRSAGFILGILVSFLVAGISYGNAPSPPSFKVIKVKDLTDDTKVESLLENSDPSDSNSRYKVGSVQKQRDGKEWLMVKGQKVFEGYNLSRASSTSDGTIAVSSYSGLHHQIDGDGSDPIIDPKTGRISAAISSVWLIDASGAKHKITSNAIHATYPVLSRDGHWLAFSGQALSDKGVSGEMQVYVVSLQNATASDPVCLNLPSKGQIIPVKWDKDDKLVVLTTEEENSSTYQLTWVQITPGR